MLTHTVEQVFIWSIHHPQFQARVKSALFAKKQWEVTIASKLLGLSDAAINYFCEVNGNQEFTAKERLELALKFHDYCLTTSKESNPNYREP